MPGKKVLLNELGREQKKKGYIPKEKLKEIARETGLPESEVFSSATFYSFLSLEKRAKHIIQVCNCPVSRMHGAERLMKHLEKRLKTKMGKSTKDKEFFLEETMCIGLCDKAPAIVVDGKPYPKMNEKKIDKLLKRLKKSKNKKNQPGKQNKKIRKKQE